MILVRAGLTLFIIEVSTPDTAFSGHRKKARVAVTPHYYLLIFAGYQMYQRYILVHHPEDVPLVEFTYLVFTRMPCESYRRRLRSLLLCLCDVFPALITSLVC